MSEGWNIALLGATGAVGEAILALLQERQFPVGELYPLASERCAGESLRFNGKNFVVGDAADFDWSQVQLAFLWRDWRPRHNMLKKRQKKVVWLSITVGCLLWNLMYL